MLSLFSLSNFQVPLWSTNGGTCSPAVAVGPGSARATGSLPCPGVPELASAAMLSKPVWSHHKGEIQYP